MSNPSNASEMSAMSAMSDASELDGETRRLDGNAAAGRLAEIFAFEMTSVQSSCAGCGRTGLMGSLLLYGGEMGSILRCPTCDAVQLRLVRVPERRGQSGQYWLDMRGMAALRIAPAMPA